MSDKKLIHIVDDDAAVRQSLSYMLPSFGFDVRVYETGTAFVGQVTGVEPGCILLDLRMPDMGGLEVQARLNDRGITLPVIMLTGHGDVATTVVAMRGGAYDFIEKPFELDVLLEEIEGAFLRHDAGAEAARGGQEARLLIASLSQREQEVLRGLVMGKQNKVIAHDLSISPRTIEVYRANLMEKLDVRSLSEALRLAFSAGLFEPPPEHRGALVAKE